MPVQHVEGSLNPDHATQSPNLVIAKQSTAVVDADEYNASPDTRTARVSIIRNLDGVERLRSVWAPWQRHPNSDIDFYMGIVRSWQERCRPHIVAIYKDDEPQAMLVGRAEDTRIECKIGYKILGSVRARRLTFIYGGQLGNLSPQNCALLFSAIKESLRRGEADLAELHFVRTDSPLYALACSSQAGLGRDFAPCVQVHRSTALPTSADEFYGTLSVKARKNQRWQAKKVAQEFGVNAKIRCFREPEHMTEMFRDLEVIASKTYQRRLGVGFDGTLEQRERLCADANRGRLRAYVLYLAGEPAAFWVGTVYRNKLHSDFMGYDPAYSKYSPGMYVVMKSVEELCDSYPHEAVRHIDWGLGDAQYKQVLGDCSWMEAQVKIFAPTARGLGVNLLTTPTALAELLLKRVLSRSGTLQKTKTKWRQRLRKT